MDDGAVVLGNLEMKAQRLLLTANSEARATRGRALLASVLGGLVRAPLVERAALAPLIHRIAGIRWQARQNRRSAASVCAGTAGCVGLGEKHGHGNGDPSAPSRLDFRGAGVSPSLARRVLPFSPPSVLALR